MTVELAEDACALVAGLGAAVSLVAPAELRDEVVRHARALLEHYADVPD
jgi:predicted DNA-binding transcriptional regulator YafY